MDTWTRRSTDATCKASACSGTMTTAGRIAGTEHLCVLFLHILEHVVSSAMSSTGWMVALPDYYVAGKQHNLTDHLVILDVQKQTDEHGHEEQQPIATRFDHRGWRDECLALDCRPDQGISLHAFTRILYGSSHHPVTGPLAWRALWHGVQKDGLERDVERYVA